MSDWALHPQVLDPQFLLSNLDRVRQDLSTHSHRGQYVSDDDWDEIREVLARSTGARRAKYQGVYADRPPPIAFLPGHPQTSAFQSVIAHCAEPLVPTDDLGRRNPLEHWLDEVQDLFRRFGPCDPRWIEVRLGELLTQDTHPFVEPPDQPTEIGNVADVILVGDWATALPQAINVSKAIRKYLQARPTIERHVIHLGDTYYCGLREEYEHRFLPHWPVDNSDPSISCWSLNGNHDMYTGGHGYFETLLTDPRFRNQRGSSNFNLRNDHWQLVGLDSAHQAPDDPSLSDGQKDWLRQAVNGSGPIPQQTILLTHHQAFSAFGDSTVSGKLAGDVTSALGDTRVAAWFWGHEHRGTVYETDVSTTNYNRVAGYTATLGHGGVPQLLGIDGRPETTVDESLLVPARGGWQFDGRYTVAEDTWALGGYAVLSFREQDLEITHFDETGAPRHGPTAIAPA